MLITDYHRQMLDMYKDWIAISVTATDEEITRDFQIPKKTLAAWRLDANKKGPQYFKRNQTILYPRKLFIIWFADHMKNKQMLEAQPSSTNTNVTHLRNKS